MRGGGGRRGTAPYNVAPTTYHSTSSMDYHDYSHYPGQVTTQSHMTPNYLAQRGFQRQGPYYGGRFDNNENEDDDDNWDCYDNEDDGYDDQIIRFNNGGQFDQTQHHNSVQYGQIHHDFQRQQNNKRRKLTRVTTERSGMNLPQ